MKITGFIVISFSIVCSTAACSDDPVAVANPEPAVTVVKVPNGSFEENAAFTSPLYHFCGRIVPARLSTVWKMVFMTLNSIIRVPEDKYPVMWQPALILRK